MTDEPTAIPAAPQPDPAPPVPEATAAQPVVVPAPTKNTQLYLVLGIVGAVAALFLVVALGVGGWLLLRPTGPSLDDAQRECRTAFQREWDARSTKISPGSYGVVPSMTGIEMLESKKIKNGYEINGSVKYTLTGAFNSLPGSLDLTCTATPGANDKILTKVTNRI